MYPMKLTGIVRSPIWGGVRLLSEWKKGTDCETVGESWELTVRKDGECRVQNGAFAGMPLRDVLRAHRDEVLGESTGDADAFPLLIKLIDAADRLSVQVHPDDAYAARVENDRGKTEMWYIVEAEENAEIICGLCEGVDTDALASAVNGGRVEDVLLHLPVRAGECYFIPAGLPHAIGKGILIAEIQQNCDLTYRVYDYDRRDKNGNLRELHVEKALDVIRPFSAEEIERIRYSRVKGAPADTLLADCDYFRVERLTLAGETLTLLPSARMRHLFPLSGEATLACDGNALALTRGEGILLPAACGEITLAGTGTYLLTEAY